MKIYYKIFFFFLLFSKDPDPFNNRSDPQHCLIYTYVRYIVHVTDGYYSTALNTKPSILPSASSLYLNLLVLKQVVLVSTESTSGGLVLV